MKNMTQQTKSKKKVTKADWIGMIVGIFIASIIFQMGSFGFIPAFIIAFGSYWVVKKIALSFTKEEAGKSDQKAPVEEKPDPPKQADEKPMKNKDSRKKWIWSVVILAILFIIVLVFNSPSNNNQDISFTETDKSSDNSEQLGNLYRNTKYNFRIKFPEGWKIEAGDGIHIVQKASSENSTISVMIQQFDLGGMEGFSSIKDGGTSKEFVNTVIEGAKEKFSNVKIVDYGETKIDNEPTYWVEYSASSQVLDYKLEMTNIIYYLAKGDIMYSISAGTASDEYSEIKPLLTQSISTFVLENY